MTKKTYKTWKRPAHGGGHLENKKQTPKEHSTTMKYFIEGSSLWGDLFSPERNKWKLIK